LFPSLPPPCSWCLAAWVCCAVAVDGIRGFSSKLHALGAVSHRGLFCVPKMPDRFEESGCDGHAKQGVMPGPGRFRWSGMCWKDVKFSRFTSMEGRAPPLDLGLVPREKSLAPFAYRLPLRCTSQKQPYPRLKKQIPGIHSILSRSLRIFRICHPWLPRLPPSRINCMNIPSKE
jgi:hypothetical protein